MRNIHTRSPTSTQDSDAPMISLHDRESGLHACTEYETIDIFFRSYLIAQCKCPNVISWTMKWSESLKTYFTYTTTNGQTCHSKTHPVFPAIFVVDFLPGACVELVYLIFVMENTRTCWSIWFRRTFHYTFYNVKFDLSKAGQHGRYQYAFRSLHKLVLNLSFFEYAI